MAVNHIKSISGESTSVNVVNDTLNSGMVILLGGDCVINGGLTAKAGFSGVVDCANFSCSTITTKEVSGNNGKATFLNCPSFTGSKVINITHDYFNCDRVTLSSFNAGNTATLNFYDCGTAATPATFSVGSYSSGPSATTTHNFYSGYYNSLSYKTCYKVYGGSFRNDPSNYNADVDNLEVVYDSTDKWYVVQTATPAEKVVSIGTKEYTSLSEAVDKAVNGDTISLIAAVDMAGATVIVPKGKNITISLDKHSISNGKIINNGTLEIMDSTIANEGEVNCDIENNWILDFVFGTYSGSVVNNSGTLTVHNGAFTKSFISAGGTVNLKGGHFKPDISGFVADEGYLVHSSGGFYWVCELPDGTLRKTTVSGASGYCATPYDADDYNLLKERVVNTKTTKSDYTAANWVRLAELLTFYEVFYNKSLDATLQFDRAVTAKSLNVYAATTVSLPLQIKQDLAANELYRGLSAALVSNGYYGKQYKALWEDKIQSVSLAIADGSSGSNAGTVCRMMIELWDSSRAPDYHDPDNKHMLTNTVLIVGEQRFTIGAGANKAMIRLEVGAATFYATVTDALAAAEDGGTVMLANDSEDDVVFAKVGTYTIDANGFAFSGSVTAAEGFTVASQGEGVYVVTSNPAAKIDVETVVSQVVSAEWLEANEIVTEGKTDEEIQAAVQDVLNEKDDNGNAKWENLVIGQKADESAAVTAANGGTETTANIAVSFDVPKDENGDAVETGYTVKYAFDQVDTAGEVVENGAGEAKDEPTLDFEEVAENKPTYFKMRAVLEASDNSEVKAEVPVEKTIGVVKVASEAEVTIIPVPWQSLGDGDIKATELVHAASLSDDDELIVYGTDGKPQTWVVKNGEWTAPAAEYTIGGGDSVPQQEEAQEAAELKRGQGVILKRSKPTETEIVLIGQAVTDAAPETPIAKATAEEPSWNLVASPKMEAVAVADVAGDNTADEIIVPTAGTPKHYTYKKNAWGYSGKIAETETEVTLPDGTKTKVVKFGHKTDDTNVPAGTGFWYLNKDSTTSEKKITW